ncbi:MAG: Thoeris anti-defense Tad2 family protein [Planctomycetota bacterium]|jgi:hypothetical protein
MADDIKDFGWALVQLRGGYKVRRSDWHHNWSMWLVLVDAKDWNNDIDVELGGPLGRDCSPWIGARTMCGGFEPWVCSHSDVLAEDWEIVE